MREPAKNQSTLCRSDGLNPVSQLPDESRVPSGEISRLTEHLFRVEAGKLVSVLTGLFGIDHLQLAEDVVQEALVRAFRTWPYYGIPDQSRGLDHPNGKKSRL